MTILQQVIGEPSSYLGQLASSGVVVPLALVCLLHYVYSIYRTGQARRLTEEFRRQIQELELALQSAQKNCSLTQLENEILRDFVSHPDVEQSLAELLQKFVPGTDCGFAAIVEFTERGCVVHQSCGLSSTSQQDLRIDDRLRQELAREPIVVLENERLERSTLLSSLDAEDRHKASRLFAVAIGEPQAPLGALLTTALCPAEAPAEEQRELVGRLMLSVADMLRRGQAVRQRETEMQVTSEMLELRSIVDRGFDSPLPMIEEYLLCLARKIGADRSALFIVSTDGRSERRPLVRCGLPLSPGTATCWQQHEDRLVEIGLQSAGMTSLGTDDLWHLGIQTLVRRALIVPLGGKQGTIGVVCLTKQDKVRFEESKLQLVRWATEFLTDSILRALNLVTIEREARLDGLTGLSNRREFDRQIRLELETAKERSRECTLMLFDLDHFKSINDTYGHQAGDEVLRVAARILKQHGATLRSGDRPLIARYGGEEMAMLLPDVPAAGALRVAEAIRKSVGEASIHFQHHRIRVTLSVGVAGFPRQATNVEELIAAADAALYQAKETGRNRVCCGEESLAAV